jgi:nitrate/nitrite-specific signal transduction histidine kinase
MRNFEQNTLKLEFVFQDGRVMTPDEAKYPERWHSVSLEQFDPDFLFHSPYTRTKDEQRVAAYSNRPAAIIRILDPNSPMPDDQRSYLRELGVRTVLIIPLTARGQANGRLTFRFTEERDFHPEELEIARALATQASLAIHLTRLAKTARQSAVLKERNQLAGEIHDSLAQIFTGISMQLGVAKEVFKTGDGLSYVERAIDLAQFGIAEARRVQHPTDYHRGIRIDRCPPKLGRAFQHPRQVALYFSFNRRTRRKFADPDTAGTVTDFPRSNQQRRSPCQTYGDKRNASLGTA